MKDRNADWKAGLDVKEFAASIAERAARRRAVNWDKWPHLPELRVWQLVALSLGMEPSAVSPTEQINEQVIALAGQEFRDRLEVVVANLAGPYEDDRGHLPDVGALTVRRPGTNRRADAWIASGEFRAWAGAIGWTMPPQFAPQTGNVGTVSSPVVADAAPATTDRRPGVGNPGSASTHPDGQAVGLEVGRNGREAITTHVELRAREMHRAEPSLTRQKIAMAIASELEHRGYAGELGRYLSVPTIVKRIPSGLTGGRARNGSKRRDK